MNNQKGIDKVFIKRILFDEWYKFRSDQDAAISQKLKRRSGTLHAGGAGRRYSINDKGASGIIASLLHPDYLRYQDMKKLRFGPSEGGEDKILTKRNGAKKIHNRLVWGRMNSISFRMGNDLRMEVIKSVRKSWDSNNVPSSALLQREFKTTGLKI